MRLLFLLHLVIANMMPQLIAAPPVDSLYYDKSKIFFILDCHLQIWAFTSRTPNLSVVFSYLLQKT